MADESSTLVRCIRLLADQTMPAQNFHRRIAMFRLLRWMISGGKYFDTQDESALICAAAELANCEPAHPSYPKRRDAILKFVEKYYDAGFLDLLRPRNEGLTQSLDDGHLKELNSLHLFVEKLLSVYQYRGDKAPSEKDALLVLRIDQSSPGETWYKDRLRKYREQLAFIYAQRNALGSFEPFEWKHADLDPRRLIRHLSRRLKPETLSVFLSQTKCVIEIISPTLRERLRESWPNVKSCGLDDLRVRPLTPEEIKAYRSTARRSASETKKAARQKPPQ